MIYLDYNASTPIKPAVREAMIEAAEQGGNPSSVHRSGRAARRRVDEARARIAALVGVKPTQVIFTSGGTEADLLAMRGIKAAQIFVSAIEHSAVLANAPGAVILPVDAQGVVRIDAVEAALRQAKPGALISVMLANNETGVLQPVAEFAALAKSYGHIIHCDAVQAAGRIPLDFASLGIDALSLSAHKIGGTQGVGALIVGEKLPLHTVQAGGGQEMNRRAGTENVPGICGFGVAVQLAADDVRDMPRLEIWRDRLQARLQQEAGEDVVVLGAKAPRVATTLNIAMRNVSSETQVAAMDLAGIAVSGGAACSSGKVKASHVLRAMGYGEDVAGCGLRISFGWNTHAEDLDRCAEAWINLYRRTRQRATQAA